MDKQDVASLSFVFIQLLPQTLFLHFPLKSCLLAVCNTVLEHKMEKIKKQIQCQLYSDLMEASKFLVGNRNKKFFNSTFIADDCLNYITQSFNNLVTKLPNHQTTILVHY